MDSFLDVIARFQTLTAALIGGAIALWFSHQKGRLDAFVFKRELILRCNERYEKLRPKLREICDEEFAIEAGFVEREFGDLDGHWMEFTHGEYGSLVRYFEPLYEYIDLCAEEHYWFAENLVDRDVWETWKEGMISWRSNSFFLKKLIERARNLGRRYYKTKFFDIFPA